MVRKPSRTGNRNFIIHSLTTCLDIETSYIIWFSVSYCQVSFKFVKILDMNCTKPVQVVCTLSITLIFMENIKKHIPKDQTLNLPEFQQLKSSKLYLAVLFISMALKLLKTEFTLKYIVTVFISMKSIH